MISTSVRGGARIEEVIFSLGLSSLEVDFWSYELYDLYYRSGHWGQLHKFMVGINQAYEHLSEERSIAFNEMFLHPGHPVIPVNTIELQFFDCSGVVDLATCFCHAKHIKKCIVVQCHSIKYIVDPAQNNLSMLEKMVLRALMDLRMICRGMVTPSTLINLKTIQVEFCPNLNNLFSSRLVLQLKNLEEINVNHCENMEEVIRRDEEGNVEGTIYLPRLKKLKLEFMPRLKSIYNGFISCSSLQSIEVITCDALRRLPLDPDDADSIPPAAALEIKGTNHWWQSLEWDEPAAKETMQAYFVQLPMVFDYVGSSSQAGEITISPPSEVPRISRDWPFEGRQHVLGSTFHHSGDEYFSDDGSGGIMEYTHEQFIQDILSGR